MFILLYTLVLLSQGNATPIPSGTVIEDAILIDIPPTGFDTLERVIPNLIPSPISIPDFSQESGTCFGSSAYWYQIQLQGGSAGIDVHNIFLTPDNGHMNFEMDLGIQLNDPTDRFQLNYSLVCVPYNCNGYVDPFPTNVIGEFTIEFVDIDGDGKKEADVHFTENLTIDIGLTGDHIHIEDCALSGLESVFQFFGGSVYDLVLNAIDINSLIAGILPELELAIEDALNQANIEQDVDLMGSTLHIVLAPNEAIIQEEGLRIVFSAGASIDEPATCVLEYDSGASKGTENPLIDLSSFPSVFDLGATISDDFINQALYSVWSGGAVCQTIDESIFALDSSILNLLTGDAFVDFFEETVPLVIKTNPKEPPVLDMSTASDVGVDIHDLGLDFYAEIDGRQSRVIGIDISTVVGVDINLEDQTGALDIAVDINTDAVEAKVYFNEFLPSTSNEAIEAEFVGQLDTILGLVDIQSLLGNLNLSLPAIVLGDASIGIQELLIKPSGGAQEDLTIFANLGTVPYGGSGCGADTGGGCGGGCSSTGNPWGRSFLFLLLVMACVRRRINSNLNC